MSSTFLTHTTESERGTIEFAERFARVLREGDCVAIFGELGAGKTRFVRGIARGLGIDPALVSSPTFVLVHEYAASGSGLGLVHLDAYRLTPEDDLETLDWERLSVPRGSVVVVEWADRLAPEALPEGRFTVTLHHAGEERRSIEIQAPAGRSLPAAR